MDDINGNLENKIPENFIISYRLELYISIMKKKMKSLLFHLIFILMTFSDMTHVTKVQAFNFS